jgi:hypothetical protein
MGGGLQPERAAHVPLELLAFVVFGDQPAVAAERMV